MSYRVIFAKFWFAPSTIQKNSVINQIDRAFTARKLKFPSSKSKSLILKVSNEKGGEVIRLCKGLSKVTFPKCLNFTREAYIISTASCKFSGLKPRTNVMENAVLEVLVSIFYMSYGSHLVWNIFTTGPQIADTSEFSKHVEMWKHSEGKEHLENNSFDSKASKKFLDTVTALAKKYDPELYSLLVKI